MKTNSIIRSQKARAFTYTLCAFLACAAFFCFGAVTVGAAAVDVSTMTSAIDEFTTTLQKFGIPIFGVVAVIGGLTLMFGQQGRQLAKGMFIGGVIGLGVVLLAPAIGTALGGIFNASIAV